MRRRESPRPAAFTLIELLVVIAIIALLISILLPTIERARMLARDAICGTNLHSLTRVMHQYAGDNDGWFPELGRDPRTNAGVTNVCYWIAGYWRDELRDTWGLERDLLYSPSNPYWNRDDFYWYGSQVRDDSRPAVMGYFAFVGYEVLRNPNFRNSLSDPPPHDPTRPLFATRIWDNPQYDMLWTDMNRIWGGGWIPSSDPQRWGANHLREDREWPRGSHVGRLDGGVTWTHGPDIRFRFRRSSADFHW